MFSFWRSSFKTFDGKMFDFQGRCKHVMVTDKCAENLSTEEKIHIEVNSMSCGSQDVTCAKEIIAKIYGTTFILKKGTKKAEIVSSEESKTCLLYTSPSPRDKRQSRMPSSA